MRAKRLIDVQIEHAKYFNARLYKGYVNRYSPPPSILYWQVQVVYVLYGNMLDRKSKKPLFNSRTWTKANQFLKDILLGHYSDPLIWKYTYKN